MGQTWANFWFETKGWVEDKLGVTPEALHFHLGLAIFLGVAFLLRRRRHGHVIAWVAVALLQGLNEILDARAMWTGGVNCAEAGRDIMATLFWPTIILLLVRSMQEMRARQGQCERDRVGVHA